MSQVIRFVKHVKIAWIIEYNNRFICLRCLRYLRCLRCPRFFRCVRCLRYLRCLRCPSCLRCLRLLTCHCHCQVSRVALCMSKVKVREWLSEWVSQWVSESVTRSPIELFWTAKKCKPPQIHNFQCFKLSFDTMLALYNKRICIFWILGFYYWDILN